MKDPAFLFYSSDFLSGTSIMSFEDKGKYITLLAQMHQTGRMDEETIRLLVGSVSDKLKAKFIIDENGMWFNERLELEIEKRRCFVDSRRENGKLGGRPTKPIGKPNGKPIGKPKENLMGDVNINENIITNKEEKTVKNPDGWNEKWEALWNEWVEYKKVQHKFVYKNISGTKKALMTNSDNNLSVATEMVNQAIMSGWTGVYNSNKKEEKKSTYAPKLPML